MLEVRKIVAIQIQTYKQKKSGISAADSEQIYFDSKKRRILELSDSVVLEEVEQLEDANNFELDEEVDNQSECLFHYSNQSECLFHYSNQSECLFHYSSKLNPMLLIQEWTHFHIHFYNPLPPPHPHPQSILMHGKINSYV